MKVRVCVVGILETLIPGGEALVETDATTVRGLLDVLVERYGPLAAKEFGANGPRKGLSLLVNGRNVLSLPEQFQTRLRDGDEVVITVQVTGG